LFLYRRNNRYWIGGIPGKKTGQPLHKFLKLSFPVTDKQTAELLLNRLKMEEIKEQLFGIPAKTGTILTRDFYMEYSRFCDRSKTRSTVKSDAFRLKRWVSFLEQKNIDSPAEISKLVLNQFIATLPEEMSNAAINRYVCLIRASLKWGVCIGYLNENPLLDFPRLPEPSRYRGQKESGIKLPPNTKWEDITLKFLDGHNALIKAKGLKARVDYKEMGFEDKKTRLPNRQWKLLYFLAESRGELTWKDSEANQLIKKKKQLLAQALKAYFQIDEDPFLPYKQEKAYKIKIRLIPE